MSKVKTKKPGIQLEVWIPEMVTPLKPDKDPGFYSLALVANVPLPVNKAPMTFRQKLARICLRKLIPSLFLDFGDDTVIGLVGVHLTSVPVRGGESVFRLDRKKADFPDLELLFPARK